MSDFFTNYKSRLVQKDVRLILLSLNLSVFLFFTILRIAHANELSLILSEQVFSFNTNPLFFVTHPWTLVTSIFTHYDFTHIFFNMLMFYFVSEVFVFYFGERKLIWIYLLGGIAGNLLEFLVGFLIPSSESFSLIGASGSVMAIFIAVAIYQPNLKVKLFGLIDLKIIYLAAFYFLWDFTRIGFNDGVAHFAHIGGAIVGFLSGRNIQSSQNILVKVDTFWKKITSKKSKKVKPIYGGKKFTDEEFNANKKANQERIDAILDKISKKGYDGLTAAEKDFLFNQSNKR